MSGRRWPPRSHKKAGETPAPRCPAAARQAAECRQREAGPKRAKREEGLPRTHNTQPQTMSACGVCVRARRQSSRPRTPRRNQQSRGCRSAETKAAPKGPPRQLETPRGSAPSALSEASTAGSRRGPKTRSGDQRSWPAPHLWGERAANARPTPPSQPQRAPRRGGETKTKASKALARACPACRPLFLLLHAAKTPSKMNHCAHAPEMMSAIIWHSFMPHECRQTGPENENR